MALFWSARLLIWRKNPSCTFILSCTCIDIGPAHLLILRKNSPLHGLILVCTFIDFEKKFPPARLFCPARLMFFKNFPTCTFISYCTSIRYTRVLGKAGCFSDWNSNAIWKILTGKVEKY